MFGALTSTEVGGERSTEDDNESRGFAESECSATEKATDSFNPGDSANPEDSPSYSEQPSSPCCHLEGEAFQRTRWMTNSHQVFQALLGHRYGLLIVLCLQTGSGTDGTMLSIGQAGDS